MPPWRLSSSQAGQKMVRASVRFEPCELIFFFSSPSRGDFGRFWLCTPFDRKNNSNSESSKRRKSRILTKSYKKTPPGKPRPARILGTA